MPESEGHPSYLRRLLELGRTLNASLDLSEVMRVAIEQVVQFVHAERGCIVLIDEASGRVVGLAAHGMEQTALTSALAGRALTGAPEVSRTVIAQALRSRQPVVSLDAAEDPRFAAHTSVRLGRVRSVLCVPLLAQGRTLGVIYVDNRVRAGVFEDVHAEMLAAFANQAAIAIENAQLYENLGRSADERLRLQQELHDKETQRLALEEASRVRADLMSHLSHELRNPITAIRGYVQTLASDEAVSEALRDEFYDTIESECDRMLDLINELLDSSRLEARRPLQVIARTVDLGDLLRRMARSVQYDRFWKPTHRLVLDVPDDLPTIEADEAKIRQIMANLLSNAVKYSPGGGVVEVRATRDADGVRITVSDQGVGISAEAQKRLFGRYERLEREAIERIPGTGLGLYLTRHLVELHRGTISCSSAPGQGTAFTVRLPVSSARGERRGEGAAVSAD